MEVGAAGHDDPDLSLLQGVADGRQQASRDLVDRHLRGLHAFAARLLGDARQQRLQALLAELPPRQREALLLFHYEGHSQAETAAILELSVDALESLLARARRSLRQRLENEPEDLR